MRKYVSLVFLFGFAFAKLFAFDNCAGGRFAIQGEYLYLFPVIDQSYYAQHQTGLGNPSGKRVNHELDFRSAYRITAAYAFCDCLNDIQFTWTHLPKFTHSDSVGDFVLATQGFPNTSADFIFRSADSHITLEHFSFDALYGLWGYQCNCVDLFLSAGLHYANINFKEQINYNDAINILGGAFEFVQNRSKLWGIGPELALDLHSPLPFCRSLCCGRGSLMLAARLKGALLASHRKANLFNSFTRITPPTTDTSSSDDQKRWDVIPFWDLRLGLNYTMAFACFAASFEAGYEIFVYHDAVNRIFFSDDIGRAITFDLLSDAKFQGPYFALGFVF